MDTTRLIYRSSTSFLPLVFLSRRRNSSHLLSGFLDLLPNWEIYSTECGTGKEEGEGWEGERRGGVPRKQQLCILMSFLPHISSLDGISLRRKREKKRRQYLRSLHENSCLSTPIQPISPPFYSNGRLLPISMKVTRLKKCNISFLSSFPYIS